MVLERKRLSDGDTGRRHISRCRYSLRGQVSHVTVRTKVAAKVFSPKYRYGDIWRYRLPSALLKCRLPSAS